MGISPRLPPSFPSLPCPPPLSLGCHTHTAIIDQAILLVANRRERERERRMEREGEREGEREREKGGEREKLGERERERERELMQNVIRDYVTPFECMLLPPPLSW